LFIDELPSWLVSIIFRFGDQGGFGVMGVFDGRLHSMNFAPFAHPKWKLSIGDAIYMYIFLKAFSFVLNFLEVFHKRIFFGVLPASFVLGRMIKEMSLSLDI
jgi:hypothetical protein